MAFVISFFVLELLIVAFGVWLGYRRGMGRSLVRFVYLLVIGVISVVVARLLTPIACEKGYGLIRNIIITGDIASVVEAAPELEILVIGLVGCLLVTVIFALLFGIMQALSMICLKRLSIAIVTKITGESEEPTKKSRWIGAGIGVASSLVVILALFAPFYMLSTVCHEVTDSALDTIEELAHDESLGMQNVDVTGTVDSISALGHLPLAVRAFDYVNLLTLGSTPHHVTYFGARELGKIENAVLIALHEAREEMNSDLNTDEDMMTVLGVVGAAFLEELADSKVSREMMTYIVRSVGIILQNGGSIGGIDAVSGTAVNNLILMGLAKDLANTTEDDLAGKIKSLVGLDLGVSGESADAGAVQYLAKADISNPQDLMKDTERVSNLVEAIYTVSENPNLGEVVSAVGAAGKEVLNSDQSPIKGISDEAVNSIVNAVNQSLQNEASKGEKGSLKDMVDPLKDDLISVADEHNVVMDDKQAELSAICMISEFLTDEAIEQYMNDPSFSISYEDIAAYLGAQ